MNVNMKWILLKSIGVFFSIYLVLLLMFQTETVKKPSVQFYMSSIEKVYGNFGSGGEVKVKTLKAEDSKHFDAIVILTSKFQKNKAIQKARKQGMNTTKIKPVKYRISTWNSFYLLLTFLIALFLATPTTWKHKCKGLLLGSLLLYTFFLFKTGWSLLLKFSAYHGRFDVGFDNRTILESINYLYNIIINSYFGLMIVVLLWFFLMFPVVKINTKNIQYLTPKTPLKKINNKISDPPTV